jgi:hypothetical protein
VLRLFVTVFILICTYGPAQAQHKLTAKQYEDAIVGIEDRIEELQREIAAEAGWKVAEVALVAGISMYAPIVMGGEIPGGLEAIKECLENFLHGKAAFETYEKWQNLQTLQNEGLRDAWGNLLRYYPAEYRRVTSARNNPMMAFYYRQSVLRKQGAAAAANNQSCPAGKGGGNNGPTKATGGVRSKAECDAMLRAYQAKQQPLARSGRGKALEALAATEGEAVRQCYQEYFRSIGAGPR